jgi:FMN reductase
MDLTSMTVGVVVGNPKPRSRTRDVAVSVARAASASAGLGDGDPFVVDLADLGPHLFEWSSTAVHDAVDMVAKCSLLVVASPTYKASYTGLLKSFLDWFDTTGLSAVDATVPVMVGGSPRHALAVEVHLRPVLVEIGASLPTRGLYVLESDLPQLDDVIAEWLTVVGPALRRAVQV